MTNNNKKSIYKVYIQEETGFETGKSTINKTDLAYGYSYHRLHTGTKGNIQRAKVKLLE